MKAYLNERKKCIGVIGLLFDLFGAIILMFFYSDVFPHPNVSMVKGGKKYAYALIPESKFLLYLGFILIIVGFSLLLVKELVSD